MNAFYESRKYNSSIPITAFRSENMDFVAHWHEEIEMIYVCEGSIGVGIHNEYRVLGKGEFAICGSSDIHYYSIAGDIPSGPAGGDGKVNMLCTFVYIKKCRMWFA